MEIIYHQSTINEVATQVLTNFSDAKYFCFDAPMGAGKTTFIKALCKQLGCNESQLSSPTFALVNEYKTASNTLVFHLDLYRINSEFDLLNLGFEDYIHTPNAKILIEWSGLALPFLAEYIMIRIDVIDDYNRKISINKITNN